MLFKTNRCICTNDKDFHEILTTEDLIKNYLTKINPELSIKYIDISNINEKEIINFLQDLKK